MSSSSCEFGHLAVPGVTEKDPEQSTIISGVAALLLWLLRSFHIEAGRNHLFLLSLNGLSMLVEKRMVWLLGINLSPKYNRTESMMMTSKGQAAVASVSYHIDCARMFIIEHC